MDIQFVVDILQWIAIMLLGIAIVAMNLKKR